MKELLPPTYANGIVVSVGRALGFIFAEQSPMFETRSMEPMGPAFEAEWAQPAPMCLSRYPHEAAKIHEVMKLAGRMDELFPAPVTLLAGFLEVGDKGIRERTDDMSAQIIRVRGRRIVDERSMTIGTFGTKGDVILQPTPDDGRPEALLDIARALARWGYYFIRANGVAARERR